MLFYKNRMREINARPIKKVIEAKAKKKDKVRKFRISFLDNVSIFLSSIKRIVHFKSLS